MAGPSGLCASPAFVGQYSPSRFPGELANRAVYWSTPSPLRSPLAYSFSAS